VTRLLFVPVLLVVLAIGLNRFIPVFAVWKSDSANPIADCRTKGNIGRSSGERIYHVPGGEWYDRTRIDVVTGERWFCSEEEARAAGWRRSYR